MEKMKRTAHILDGLCLLLMALTVISTLLAIVAQLFAVRAGDVDLASTTMDGITWTGPVNGGAVLFASVLVSLVQGGALVAGFVLVRRMLRPMKAGEPFTGTVTRTLRQMGALALAAALLHTFYELWGKTLIAHLAAGGGAVGVAVSHQVQGSLFLLAGLLFLLSYVFRYGEELQRLSDETL